MHQKYWRQIKAKKYFVKKDIQNLIESWNVIKFIP